jgi:Fibronectin type III domain/Immunoglobulin I-set domain/Immunoglobulin domain
LSVEEPDPTYNFIKMLDKKCKGYYGHDFDLECAVNSGKAQVYWTKNGERIDQELVGEGKKYQIIKELSGFCKLTVNNCTQEDATTYGCHIEKQPDKTESVIQLSEFQYKFTKILKSARLIEKDTLTLACELNDSRGDVKWFKGEEELQGDKRIEIIKDGRKRKIIIKDAKVSDAGQFSCVSNADKTIADITVNYQNKFLKKLKDQDIIERDRAVLEVELQDQTAPTDWFLNGTQLKDGEDYELKNLGGGKHQLVIKKVKMEDAGELECKSGDLNSKCTLTVLKGETGPIVDAPESVEAPIDKGGPFEIVIPYRIDGTRKSPVQAKICGPDGKPLGKSDCEVIIKDDKVIFKIKKPSRAMSGPYKTTIENAQGSVDSPIKLNMMTPPTAPQKLELRDLFESNFVLKWSAPADDGGAPIIGYKIESWYAYSPADADVITVDDKSIRKVVSELERYFKPSITRYKVEGFRKNQVLRVRIRAANKVGESEPANIADRITMKNPWSVPNPPRDPEVFDWTATTMSVQWKAPDSDGGSPITGYLIEYKEKLASTWKQFYQPEPNKLNTVINELRTGASYVIRIKARNVEGDSEPCAQTPPKIAKERFVRPFFVDVATMQNQTIRKGQMCRWDIAYGGEPEPTGKWGFSKGKFGVAQEVEIKPDDHITVEMYDKNSVLTVKKAVRTDSGRYYIRVTNEVGSAEHFADLLVLDKPSPPDGEPEATKIRSDSATVAFRPPKDDGGCPILGYIVEKMDTETGRWVGAGECGPDATELEVKGLVKGKRYKLRVKAYNKEGESEPSEMSQSFVAQNPYGKFAIFECSILCPITLAKKNSTFSSTLTHSYMILYSFTNHL